MKKSSLFLVCYLSMLTIVSAADKYWVGPSDGNWNNDLNWASSSGGVGGAGVPGTTDAVIFNGITRVNVDTSFTIFSLRTSFGSSTNIVLYTSAPTVITILNSLRVEPLSTLKDSTHGNVAFNVIFNGATHATGSVYGDWIFEGDTPLSGAGGHGAKFTAGTGSVVTIAAILLVASQGGRIISKRNSGIISSAAATLKFSYYSFFVLDNNLNAVVPLATWAKDSVRAPNTYDGILGAPASTISIIGNMAQLQFLGGVPTYGRMVIDLPSLSTDVSLSLPNGSKIRGNLEILNTNNHTLTLLAGTSSTSSVLVTVGTNEAGASFGGALIISGTSTKVALARATAAAPATSYKLLVNKGFSQAGGNFSLQDYDNATGSSILAIKNDFIQTGGSFITNSTSVSPFASFVLVMDDPNRIVGPSGGFFSSRVLNLSSGTIDNDRHMVTLRIDHSVYSNHGFESLQNGVLLQSPLEVGRLQLVRSPLTTTALNVITVTDPSPEAITIGTTGRSYVNGPLRRITNTTQPYVFPTGKGNNSAAIFIFDSCVVMPASATSSLYQAEYFKTGYTDRSVTLPLKGVSRSDYWDISRISGSDAQVKLTVRAAVVGAGATDGLVVAHFENNDWITQNGWVLTPGTSTAGSVTSKLLSGFGAFTIGYLNPTALPANVPGGLSYKYYEGVFDVLPDFSTLTPIKTGVSENVNLAVRPEGVNDGFAFVWEGNINIPTAGIYTFETVSDDGSKIYFDNPYAVNGTSLVTNDGLHAPGSATGTITIPAAGLYPITMTFFEKDGGETMQVYWTGPGISRQLIPDIAFTSANSAAINTSTVVLNNPRTTGVSAEPINGEKQSAEIRKIYPNPFAESFTIDYYNSNSVGHNVSIGIYDLKGMLLYSCQPGDLSAGYNKFTINLGGRNLAEGVYIAQLKINGIPASSVKLIKANR